MARTRGLTIRPAPHPNSGGRGHEARGESITLQTAGPGDFVAEASLFSTRYHCDGVCPVASQLLGDEFIARDGSLVVLTGNPPT